MQVLATPVASVGQIRRAVPNGDTPARCWLKRWIG